MKHDLDALQRGVRPQWRSGLWCAALLTTAVVASAQQSPRAEASRVRPTVDARGRVTVSSVRRAWAEAPTATVREADCESVSSLEPGSADRVNLTGAPCLLEGRPAAAARQLDSVHAALRPGGTALILARWDEDDDHGGVTPLVARRAMHPDALRSLGERRFRVLGVERSVDDGVFRGYAVLLQRRP